MKGELTEDAQIMLILIYLTHMLFAIVMVLILVLTLKFLSTPDNKEDTQ